MSKKTKNQTGMPELTGAGQDRDEALFDALGKSRKRKKRRIIVTVLIVVAVLAAALVIGVFFMQRSVRERFASSKADVLSYEVTTGSISTVVSGSGMLSNVDTETVSVPEGVEIDEILVEYRDTVEQGSLLATVDMATVRTAMASLQTQIDDLDEQISEAEEDQVSSSLKSGVSGRVKILYADKGDAVTDVMYANGALAVLSLDGYMAVDIEYDDLCLGDGVTVVLADGTEKSGKVETVIGNIATILVTDNGPKFDEEVTVMRADGEVLGSGKLYIHNPLAITGYAGTVSKVKVTENQKVSSGTVLFTLTDTASSANYDALLRQRAEAEETLLELLQIQRSGGITAPITGSVYAVSGESSDVVTISPDVSMSVSITVDESDILSLEVGQTADVTVSSVSEESLSGTVTQIDTSSTSGSYTAVITLDKIEGMLPGMTASVDVRIEGVDDALIIPVEALHQTSTGAYVYTSYNEETQEYGGMVDVVAGLSNNNYVQIKSGLSVGDVVYYTESQSISNLFGNMGFGGNMGGGSAGTPSGNMGSQGNNMGGQGSNMGGQGSNMGGQGGNMPDFGGGDTPGNRGK